MENTKNVIDVITDEYDNLFPTEKNSYLHQNNPQEVIMLNVSELAKEVVPVKLLLSECANILDIRILPNASNSFSRRWPQRNPESK